MLGFSMLKVFPSIHEVMDTENHQFGTLNGLFLRFLSIKWQPESQKATQSDSMSVWPMKGLNITLKVVVFPCPPPPK